MPIGEMAGCHAGSADRLGVDVMMSEEELRMLAEFVAERLTSLGAVPTAPAEQAKWYTPKEVASLLRVRVSRVFGWIRSGKLEAVDTNPEGRKPRYKIFPEALFAMRVKVAPAPMLPPRRNGPKPAGWVEYY